MQNPAALTAGRGGIGCNAFWVGSFFLWSSALSSIGADCERLSLTFGKAALATEGGGGFGNGIHGLPTLMEPLVLLCHVGNDFDDLALQTDQQDPIIFAGNHVEFAAAVAVSIDQFFAFDLAGFGSDCRDLICFCHFGWEFVRGFIAADEDNLPNRFGLSRTIFDFPNLFSENNPDTEKTGTQAQTRAPAAAEATNPQTKTE